MGRRFTIGVTALALVIGLAGPAHAAEPHTSPPARAVAPTAPARVVEQPAAHPAARPAGTPPGDPGPSVATMMAYMKGKSLGPSVYTEYGKETLVSFTKSGPYELRNMSTPVYVNPTVTADGTSARVRPNGMVVPNSWYNPTSWDWGHILGSTWDGLWHHCVSGAVNQLVGTASGTLAFNLAARGGKMLVGPWGYAALAFGGCMAKLVGP